MTRRNDKHIVFDDPTREFLCSLKEFRIQSGMSQQQVARYVGICECSIRDYENGRHNPSLRTLMKLAELFKHDISGSINYKYYHGKINARELKRRLNEYGLTYPELSKLTGYDTERITESVNLREHGSILCLSAVIEVIKREEYMWQFRRSLFAEGPYRKVYLR